MKYSLKFLNAWAGNKWPINQYKFNHKAGSTFKFHVNTFVSNMFFF